METTILQGSTTLQASVMVTSITFSCIAQSASDTTYRLDSRRFEAFWASPQKIALAGRLLSAPSLLQSCLGQAATATHNSICSNSNSSKTDSNNSNNSNSSTSNSNNILAEQRDLHDDLQLHLLQLLSSCGSAA